MTIEELPKKTHVVRIGPARGWQAINLAELWEYHELFYFLTWRAVKIRYKQTLLGVAWAVLQPLGMMLVFTLVFGRLVKVPSDGAPYPIFVYTALLPWQLFSRAVADSASSLVTDQRTITKIYFPRLIVPTSSVLAAMVDLAIAGVLIVGLMFLYGIVPSLQVLWLPAFVLLMFVTSLGIGLWLSALNMEFRDVQYLVPFFNQAMIFLTPVVYPASLVPEQWRSLYSLNPMVGVVEGFRWSLLDTGSGPGAALGVSIAMASALFVSGLFFFRQRERVFADVAGGG